MGPEPWIDGTQGAHIAQSGGETGHVVSEMTGHDERNTH